MSTRRPPEPLRGRAVETPDHTVGVFVYRGASTSDVDQPVHRLAERLNADVVFVGPETGSVPGVEPARAMVVTHTPDSAPDVDVLVIPGGLGWRKVVDDDSTRAWLDATSATARGVLTVSTGSLLLASVGRLVGQEATGHWLAKADLAALGASVVDDRTASVDHGRIVMASGALAALHVIDTLADRILWGL